MNNFFEIDDPEVDEDFLALIQQGIGELEYRNLWGEPASVFPDIRKECKRLEGELNQYEKHARFKFPVFKQLRKRIEDERSRCWSFEYRALNGGFYNV